MMRFRCLLFGFHAVILVAPSLAAEVFRDDKAVAQPPYPASPMIKGIEIDWATHERHGQGSDNWQLTWADDGHQYAPWGDGGGFGGTNSQGRVSLGVARIEGPWDNYRGLNVWGGARAENPATFGGKSWGILGVDGTLYMWVGKGSGLQEMQSETRLYRSRDHAATWQAVGWAFTRADELTIPTICQFGRDYSGARDDYVYTYFLHPSPAGATVTGKLARLGAAYLARVGRFAMMDKDAYEFFGGWDKKGQPTWSPGARDKKPVFQDRNGAGWCLSVSYNRGLRRYILITNHTYSSCGNLGIFDAPEPWGPWTTVAYMNRAENTHFGHGQVADNVFFVNIPTKWTSKEGTALTFVFTGAGRGRNNDSWNTVRGRFQLIDANSRRRRP